LTPAADRIVSNVTSATGQIVDSVTPALANTTSQALASVGQAVDSVTERLNAISPAVVSKLDPDFAAGLPLLLPEKVQSFASLPLPDKFADPLGKLASDDRNGLFGAVGGGNFLADKVSGPLGGDALSAGPATCLAGCGGKLLSGLGETVGSTAGALGIGQGPLLGPAIGGASASGGAGPSGSGGGGLLTSGPISSTAGPTTSVLGGATKLLGRR
jgi:chlorosome envelope protein H-like repeat protein